MNESDYHRFADMALNNLYAMLEKADEEGSLDVDFEQGVMTIRLPTGQHYIINKHAVSREIWLSSPLSGGLHFSYKDGDWVLADGRKLEELLLSELEAMADIALN